MRYLLFFITLWLMPFCYATDNTGLIHLSSDANETLINGKTLDLTTDLSSPLHLQKFSLKVVINVLNLPHLMDKILQLKPI